MNRRRVVLFVLLGVVVLGSGFYFLRFREPAYHGIALSTWLEDLNSQEKETHDRAEEAVRQMGTKALPPLLKMLNARDSKLKMKLQELAEKQSLFEFHFNSATDSHRRANDGFAALGPVAEPISSSLIKFFSDEDSEVRNVTMNALVAIGPKAVLPLMKAVTNQNSRVRFQAALTLGYVGSGSQNVVPALIRCLKDKDSSVRGCAAISLGEIGNDATNVLPVLIESLEDTDPSVRAFSAQAISKFGEEAKPAVPALLKALRDQDRIVRIRATSTLLTIDPETAARSGVKFPVF